MLKGVSNTNDYKSALTDKLRIPKSLFITTHRGKDSVGCLAIVITHYETNYNTKNLCYCTNTVPYL